MYENFRLYSVDDSLHLARTTIEKLCALLYRQSVDKPRICYLSVTLAVQKFVDYKAYLAVRILTGLHTVGSCNEQGCTA
jgi:hypothetical protein